MPNSPSSSFIPKQGPAKHTRQAVSRQVHLFTVLSYVLFFTSLIGTVGVFIYNKHTEKTLGVEVAALNSQIGNFSDVKMEEVRSFNMRLQQAADRIGNSVSTVAVLEALQAATVQAIDIDKLRMERIGDETFVVTAEINTDTFDSSLFQRGVYERSPVVQSVSIEDLGLAKEEGSEGETKGVSFKAQLFVPLAGVPYEVSAVGQPIASPVPQTTSGTTSISGDVTESNQDTL